MTPTPETAKRTPLHDAHVAAGAKMVPFGGWEMPLHYGSHLAEHKATREGCGLFDVSHMGQVQVDGADAERLLQEIVTQNVAALGDGDEVYTVMCRDDGGLIDDLIVSRFDPLRFFLVVNASTYNGDVARMREIAERLALPDAILTPCSENWAMIAVQGPKWAGVAAAVLPAEGEWRELKPFKTRPLEFDGAELIFSTTGYTGEPGCELLCPPAKAAALWAKLVAGGGTPVGLAARDSLRLEKGFCLSGQDFTTADNPLEAGLGWVVKLSKKSFAGKEPIAAAKAEGIKRRLVGLLPEGRRIPRHGAKILAAGVEAGEVTSGGFAPSLGRGVALGYVAIEHAKKGTEVEIDLGRGATCKAAVTRPPFYPPRN